MQLRSHTLLALLWIAARDGQGLAVAGRFIAALRGEVPGIDDEDADFADSGPAFRATLDRLVDHLPESRTGRRALEQRR